MPPETPRAPDAPAPAPESFRPLTLHKVALGLIVVAVVIILIALASLLGHQRTEGRLSENLHVVFWYFDVGREYNLATWYNSGLWLVMGALAAAIAVARPALHRSWWLLASDLGLIVVAVVIILIALASLLGHQRTEGRLSENLHVVFWYFDVGREYNLATWYNSGLWLVMGALAAAIAVARPALHRSWWLLAGVALFASVDEYLEVHERLDVPGDVLAQHLPVEIGFTWVLVGAPIALVVGALLLRLVLSL